MNWETLKNLYIDVFRDPKVGWYDQAKNMRALDMAREMGIPFMDHVVDANDPYKVIDMYDRPRPGQYRKVNIPPRSQLSENGKWYKVPPKNIIPYSPNNKSLANVLMRKGLKAGMGYLRKGALPLAILQYQLNNPAY